MVDSGNFSDNPTAVGDVRTRALLEGMARIGYQAVNVGERDIRFGWEKFQERTRESKLQFVSANLVDKESGRPIFPTHTVVEAIAADGRTKLRVGVVGVSRFNPIFSKPGPDGTTLSIAHPIDRARAAVAELAKEDVDLTVLLAAMHRDDSAKLVKAVGGIDFVLGSYGGFYTQVADRLGDTALIYTGNQGKRVGITRVYLGAERQLANYQTKLHLLASRYPSVPELLDFVNETYKEEDRVRGTSLTGAAVPAGQARTLPVGRP